MSWKVEVFFHRELRDGFAEYCWGTDFKSLHILPSLRRHSIRFATGYSKKCLTLACLPVELYCPVAALKKSNSITLSHFLPSSFSKDKRFPPFERMSQKAPGKDVLFSEDMLRRSCL